MANRDQLVSAIDKFIVDYGMLPYGGLPFISTTLPSVNESLDAGIKFTTADFQYVADYFANKYTHYTYNQWYDGLLEYMSGRLTSAPTEAGTTSKMWLVIAGIAAIFLLITAKNE